MPVDLVPGEGSLLGLQIATSCLCPPMAEGELSVDFLYDLLVPSHFLKALCPNIVTLGIRASTYDF